MNNNPIQLFRYYNRNPGCIVISYKGLSYENTQSIRDFHTLVKWATIFVIPAINSQFIKMKISPVLLMIIVIMVTLLCCLVSVSVFSFYLEHREPL